MTPTAGGSRTEVGGAAAKVKQLLDTARKEAEHQKQQILETAQAAATAEKDRAVREIHAAKNAALQDLAKKSVDTAVDLASKIVHRQLSGNDHAELIGDALQRFSNDKLTHWEQAVTNSASQSAQEVNIDKQRLASLRQSTAGRDGGPGSFGRSCGRTGCTDRRGFAGRSRSRATLASPRISVDDKSNLLDRVSGGRFTDSTLTFLKVLARHGRLDCLRQIRRAAQNELNESRQACGSQCHDCRDHSGRVTATNSESFASQVGP